MNILNKIIKYIRLSYRDKILILKILLLLLHVYLFVKLLPMRFYYSKFVFNATEEYDYHLQPYIHEIRLINSIVKLFPFQVTCLMECMLVQRFFLKYNVLIPIRLGLQTTGDLKAHAWYSRPEEQKLYHIIMLSNEREKEKMDKT